MFRMSISCHHRDWLIGFGGFVRVRWVWLVICGEGPGWLVHVVSAAIGWGIVLRVRMPETGFERPATSAKVRVRQLLGEDFQAASSRALSWTPRLC